MNWQDQFVLMNRDIEVLSFSTKRDAFGSVDFQEIKQFGAPLPAGYETLTSWIEHRQAPKHREHIAELLRACGCYDLDGYIRVTHALSLNDTFWVKPIDSGLKWESVSLYTNEFNEIIARLAFEGGLHGEHFTSTSPEFATDGAHAKCWVRRDQDTLLLKKGSSGARNTGLEPYSEFYAWQVARHICNETVQYDLEQYRGSLVSSCALFTSEETGFVPAGNVIAKTNRPAELLRFFESIGSGDAFRRMLVFDALVLNTDRHMGNYGVMLENETQKFLHMAPVFDHNQALLPYAEQKDFDTLDPYLAERPTRIGVDFNQVAHQMLTPAITSDLRNLKGFTFTRHEKYNLPEERLKHLEQMIQSQIEKVLRDIHLYVPEPIREREAQPKFELKPKDTSSRSVTKEKQTDIER